MIHKIPFVEGTSVGSWFDYDRGTQGARKSFEKRLDHMVAILAVKKLQMQCQSGIHGDGPEKILRQLGFVIPDAFAFDGGIIVQERTAADIQHAISREFPPSGCMMLQSA